MGISILICIVYVTGPFLFYTCLLTMFLSHMSHICPYFQKMKPGGNIKPNHTHPIQVYLLIYITSDASFHALPPPHSTVWCCWLSVLCKRLWYGNLCSIATAGPLVAIKLESDDDVLRERELGLHERVCSRWH